MTFKDKILMYFHRKSVIVDNECNEHKNYIRFHNVDEVDYLESIIYKTRKDMFDEILSDIMSLVSAYKADGKK